MINLNLKSYYIYRIFKYRFYLGITIIIQALLTACASTQVDSQSDYAYLIEPKLGAILKEQHIAYKVITQQSAQTMSYTQDAVSASIKATIIFKIGQKAPKICLTKTKQQSFYLGKQNPIKHSQQWQAQTRMLIENLVNSVASDLKTHCLKNKSKK